MSRKGYVPQAYTQGPLPDYLDTCPGHVTKHDVDFVREKGAFRLPSPVVRDKLWASYFQLVHPFVPILDRQEILLTLQLDPGTSKIGLLLFHSVMLISRLFLDAYEGRGTKPATLDAMFNTVRALLDIDWEKNQMVVLQSLVLLTYYPCQIEKYKGPLCHVSHAVTLAYLLGLHRDPPSVTNSPREISLRKRLWWGIYIRERFLSLDHGTPWAIDETAYDVPLPCLEDFFDFSLPSQEASGEPNNNSENVLLFMETAKLAVLMAKLPPIMISTDLCGAPSIMKSDWKGPLPGLPTLDDLDHISRRLDNWLAEMPVPLAHAEASSPKLTIKNGKLLRSAQQASLMLSYSIVCDHLAAVRFLSMTAQGGAPGYTIKALWVETRLIISQIEELEEQKILPFTQLHSPSLIRPLLICVLLNRGVPRWTNPYMKRERLPLLVSIIGGSDLYFKMGSTELAAESSRSPVLSELDSYDKEENLSPSATLSGSSNIFDELFTEQDATGSPQQGVSPPISIETTFPVYHRPCN